MIKYVDSREIRVQKSFLKVRLRCDESQVHHPRELLAIARIFDHYVTRDRNIEESNILGTFESPDFKYRYQNGGAWFDMVWFRVYQNVFSVNGHNFRHDFPTNAFENHFAHANCMTTRQNFGTERKVVIFTHLMKIP